MRYTRSKIENIYIYSCLESELPLYQFCPDGLLLLYAGSATVQLLLFLNLLQSLLFLGGLLISSLLGLEHRWRDTGRVIVHCIVSGLNKPVEHGIKHNLRSKHSDKRIKIVQAVRTMFPLIPRFRKVKHSGPFVIYTGIFIMQNAMVKGEGMI